MKRKQEEDKVDLLAKLQEENRKLNARIADLEAENSSLKKLNDWYIEQFKLRQKEKFGRSSEKDNDDQLSFLIYLMNQRL